MLTSGRLAVVSTGLLLSAQFAYVWPFSVDDSFIAAQYARRIAQGLGYTFRDGPPTDGVTGPLWLVPLSLASRLGLDAAIAAKGVGGLCALAAAMAIVHALGSRAGGRRAAWWGAALCASSVPLVLWSVAGLETGAAALAATLLALAVTARPEPHPLLAGASAGALAWLRPELAPYAWVLLLALWLREARAGRKAIVLAGAGALLIVAFRWILFGHTLPMSAAAKPPLLENGARYVLEPALLASTVCLMFVVWLARRHARWRELVLLSAVLVHGLALVVAGGDWMPGMRLFAPIAPALALAVAPLLARLTARPSRLAWSLCLLLVVARGLEVAREAHAARRAGFSLVDTARELVASCAQVRGTVVALDVGALAYFGVGSVVDLGGLTEPRVAYARGGHLEKRFDANWLAATRPERVVLHSRERPRVDAQGYVRWFAGYPVERRVLALPWIARGYRVERVIEHAPNYFYMVLTPRRGGNSPDLSSGNERLGDPSHPADVRRLATPRVLAP